ncbi:MAG TPA: hypothetical protein VK456_07240 [Xanthobacteraceae bacterium]|nr:hypothetical protein [Xanthobacteraceae bacterium]
MRPSSPRYFPAALLAVALAAPLAHAQPAGAGGDAAARAAPAPVRTGKERLGEKWSDEQRVDNCKVPPDKRGAKARPDTCPPELTH